MEQIQDIEDSTGALSISDLIACVEACLAVKPYLRPMLQLPRQIPLNRIHSGIFFQNCGKIDPNCDVNKREALFLSTSLTELMSMQSALLIFAVHYANCANSTNISKIHLNTLQFVCTEALLSLPEEFALYRPCDIYQATEVTATTSELNDAMCEALTICKEVLSSLPVLLEAARKQDNKVLKIYSKTSPLDSIGPCVSLLFSILGLAHCHLLQHLRNQSNQLTTSYGVIETLILGSLIRCSKSQTEEIKSAYNVRNANCIRLCQKICAAVVCLTVDDKTTQQLYLARSKSAHGIICPEVEHGRFLSRNVDIFLSCSSSETFPIQELSNHTYSSASKDTAISELSGQWDMKFLILQCPAIHSIFTHLSSLTTAYIQASHLSSISSIKTQSNLNLSHESIWLFSALNDPKCTAFWAMQSILACLCRSSLTIDNMLSPSIKYRIERVKKQIYELHTVTSPSTHVHTIRTEKCGMLLDKLNTSTQLARLESELHSLQLLAKSKFPSTSRLIEVTHVLSMSKLSDEQQLHNVSVVWGIALQLKAKKDAARKNFEAASIESVLNDKRGMRETEAHIKELMIQKNINAKTDSQLKMNSIAESSTLIKRVVDSKQLAQIEALKRVEELRLESIALKSALDCKRLPAIAVEETCTTREELSESIELRSVKLDSGLNAKVDNYFKYSDFGSNSVPSSVLVTKTKINPVITASVIGLKGQEERIWATEEARLKREHDEYKRTQERNRRAARLHEDLEKATQRVEKGSFAWHNGRFGFYDNSRYL